MLLNVVMLYLYILTTYFFSVKLNSELFHNSFKFVCWWWLVGGLMLVSRHLFNPNPTRVLVVLLFGLSLLLSFDKKNTDNKIHTSVFTNIKH